MTRAQSLLAPFSVLYSVAARLRAWSYRAGILRQKRLKGAVISIGNLTVGGTGKTPMVVWLAQRLSQSGKRTGILCRGYRTLPRRSTAGDCPAVPEGWNDEMALLRARLGSRVELGAGVRRYKKGKELEKLAVECFVLDDGFQHLPLARDVDIVIIDATNPFGGGRVLPAGRLREPISALRRADIVVVTRTDHAPAIEAMIRRHTPAPVFYARTELLGLEAYGPAATATPVDEPRSRKCFAFCGIGNPAAFFEDLGKWRFSVTGRTAFRDHHFYTERDVEELEASAAATGAEALVCTEKDIHDFTPLRTKRIPLFYCRVSLRFSDEDGLWRAIWGRLERKQAGILR